MCASPISPISRSKMTSMNNTPLVSIVMGSDSDLDIMNEAAKALTEFGVGYEIDITSAHRSPARTSEYSRALVSRGVKVVIAGAGGAAHLAGGRVGDRDHIAGDCRADSVHAPSRPRFVAGDGADARGHSLRDGRDRQAG